ncbi:MAG: TIGR00300 family protein [Methanocellales archaeon]|nr:TIGR00300 family protein [Methanocellales archaeon]
MEAMREIELEGHIIDSMILTKVFDKIMDMDGEFEILDFRIGKHKTETSYARLMIIGEDDVHVDRILSELHRLGARLPEMEDALLERTPADKVIPKGFYSTTNHPTYVRHNGKWLTVEDIGMDCLIQIDGNRAICKPLSHVLKGDLIVIGPRGVRVTPPERPRKRSIFEFMGNATSSERPSETLIHQIAEEIIDVKNKGGKIAVVIGPAVVHTGAAGALAEMVKKGYVSVLLAGNALAVHDIEYNLYGTSLGMDIGKAEPVSGGHKHHIYAISEVMRAGSIRAAVEQGIITGGIMYECIKNDTPFVLAGSIRDDGPLPDVITDVMVAQDKMRAAVKDVDLVLMMATMLHSIAIGNRLPSYVKTIFIDINPATVTKIMDRGTAQAMGIVTDVGTFLPMLVEELDSLESL